MAWLTDCQTFMSVCVCVDVSGGWLACLSVCFITVCISFLHSLQLLFIYKFLVCTYVHIYCVFIYCICIHTHPYVIRIYSPYIPTYLPTHLAIYLTYCWQSSIEFYIIFSVIVVIFST